MIANNFNYTGKVSIEVARNGHLIRKRYMNSGTSELFKMFAYALTGKDVSGMLPDHFIITKGEGSDKKTSISLPIIKIYYPEVTYPGITDPVKNICRLQCNLPLFKIEDLIDTTGGKYKLHIYSYEGEELANVDIEEDSFTNLSLSDQVIIVWDLYVTNPPTPNEEEKEGE